MVNLTDLPDNVMLLILELCPSVSRLARSCSRIYNLWTRIPSARTNWLLRCCRNDRNQALDLVISTFKDYEVAINLLQRISTSPYFSPLWLSHVLIDLTRMEPPRQTPKQQHTLPTPPTTEVHESLTSLLLRIGSGNSHHPSPIPIAPPILKQQPIPLSPYKQNIISSTKSLSYCSPVLFAKLVETLIDAGADLDTDMGLYLKSLLFTGGGMGYGNTSGGCETHIAWLVNESHRETKMKEENAILTGLLIDEITGASNGGKIQAGFAASYFCIVGCHSEALKVLLETGKVGVSGMDNFLVQVACQVGSVDCVKVLCEYADTTGVQGFDLWARDGGALRLAKLGEHEELVKYLEQEMLHKREE